MRCPPNDGSRQKFEEVGGRLGVKLMGSLGLCRLAQCPPTTLPQAVSLSLSDGAHLARAKTNGQVKMAAAVAADGATA